MRHLSGPCAWLPLLSLAACGSGAETGGPMDLGIPDLRGSPDLYFPPDLTPPETAIKHVVLIVQENHTFDAYFGRYCTQPTGSNPTCNQGPACCERAPNADPSGATPTVLDDSSNGASDRDHQKACELTEIDGGKMDHFVTGSSVSGCASAINWALATDQVAQLYHGYAAQYALGDRYFQPLVGQSSSNDMYLAVAQHVFDDNDFYPAANGHGCWGHLSGTKTLTGKTIADVLLQAGKTFAVYAMGLQDMINAADCPSNPSDCTFNGPEIPHVTPTTCMYDPSDIPFQYYSQFQDNFQYIKDYTTFAKDLAGNTLPSFSYLKAATYKNEHPNYGTKISYGTAFVQEVVGAVMSSPYANDTLILLTWDEGGGFYDHVAPPPDSPVDHQPYGTRVPILAIGRFARKNWVSHVTMEHSSIVKFLEFNFTKMTGQLAARDAVVNNLGSLLDPVQTGLVIPEN